MVEKKEFMEWLMNALKETDGDLERLQEKAREGAARFGRVPRDVYGLLPFGMTKAYSTVANNTW